MENLVAALAKARLEFDNPDQDKKAVIPTKTGPGYSYRYASLAEILDSVSQPLSRQGLALATTIAAKDGILFAIVGLYHESGESLISEYPMPEGLPAKDFGGVLKTVRRHLICALLNISPIESDEDSGASAHAKPPAPRKQTESSDLAKPLTVQRVNQAMKRLRLTKEEVQTILHDYGLPSVAELSIEQCDDLIDAMEREAALKVPSEKISP